MATEKATDTTATQNLSPTLAKARTTRSKTSTAALQPETTANIATAIATQAAPKKPRARATAKSKLAAAQAANAEVIGAEVLAENVAVERSLLETESSKLLHAHTVPAKPACKAHCGQCGREMRFVPFSLSNLMCRSCYGLDRYRRPTSPSLSSLTSSRPSGPR
jgi:hypothetical protein